MVASRLAFALLFAALPAAAETLPDPAPAAPPPVLLSDRPAAPRPAAPLPVVPGVPAPEAGGYRWTGPGPDSDALRRLGAALAAHPGRLTIEVEVAGPAQDASAARRASLDRARALRDALAEGGRDPRRVDLVPRGRGASGQDRVAVLAGGAGP
jgi:hypothetical protein